MHYWKLGLSSTAVALYVVQHPLEIELFPLATNLFFFHLHFDDDITGNVRQIMPLF